MTELENIHLNMYISVAKVKLPVTVLTRDMELGIPESINGNFVTSLKKLTSAWTCLSRSTVFGTSGYN